jgi:hypothetical protein
MASGSLGRVITRSFSNQAYGGKFGTSSPK